MRPADWRALIQAYVEERLSADAFKRRFLEAFEAAERSRHSVPAAVQNLYYVVEAYAGDPMGRGHAVSDDSDLIRAARAALQRIPEEAIGVQHPSERPRVVIVDPPPFGGDGPGGGRPGAGPGGRVYGFNFRTVGALGCLGCLGYVLLGILQFFAAAAQVEAVLGLGPAPSAILGLLVAFLPVIGGLVAFFGAMDVWGWPGWLAAVFLVSAVLTAFGGWGGWREARRR